jgi:hypothetical protein
MEHEHKTMIETLAEHFEEEIEDACEYAHLSEEYPHEAIAFWELGREEATHANYMHTLLEKHGYEFPEEHLKKFYKMMRKFHFIKD